MGLFLAWPLFLWACALGGVQYVGVPRYYIPLIPMALLIAWSLAFPISPTEKRTLHVTQSAATTYVALYFLMAVVSTALFFVPGRAGAGRRALVFGTVAPYRFSLGSEYEFSPARQYVLSLLKQQPDTILVTNRPHWFYADPEIERSRLHRLEHFKSSHVTGPTRILVMVLDPFPTPDTALYWLTSYGKAKPAPYFEPVSDLHLIRRFPDEKIKVLEANIPAGVRIELNVPHPTR